MSEKFVLCKGLGIITVPVDYKHVTRLERFHKKYRKQFNNYDNDIMDGHFRDPSRILRPGDRIHVSVFKQNFSGTTTSEERLAFLKSKKAVFVGAQGASLAWEEKRHQLPRDYSYVSFDHQNNLWKDDRGDHRVPIVRCGFEDNFDFILGCLEGAWFSKMAFFCFCDAE